MRFHWSDILFRPFWRFYKSYLFKRGFMDGRHGILIAFAAAFAVMIKYFKLWEIQLNEKQKHQQDGNLNSTS